MRPSPTYFWILLCCAAAVVAENACPDGEKRCAEGCVSIEHKCKRQICPYPLIECKDRRKCYDKEQRCDKVFDCLDRSDEHACGRTTPSPYYFNPNRTNDTGPEDKTPLFKRWPGILLIVVVLIVISVVLIGVCIYWTLKCRLIHDQIAYDEKHKFMEEHGEMPSAGPVISGIRPPQDGWKFVTKSPYMMMEEAAANAKPPAVDKEPLRTRTSIKAAETITEAEEEQASPGTPPPSAATSPSPPASASSLGNSRATSPEAGSPVLQADLADPQSSIAWFPGAGSSQAASPGSPPRYDDAVSFPGATLVRADSPGEEV